MRAESPILRQFDYRPRKWQTLFVFLVAVAGSGVLAYFAITLDEPIVARRRGVQLTVTQARVLFGAAAALSPIGVIPLGFFVYVAFAYDRRVALTPSHLILPRPTRMGAARDEVEIPLSSISLVYLADFIGSSKLLRLHHQDGILSIPSNMFQSRAEFDELCRLVGEAVHEATGVEHQI